MDDKTTPLSAVAVDPLVMRRLLIHLYNTAYHAGHEDTVEGCYTDVLPVDMDSYHDDVVDEWVEEYLDNEFSARNEESHAKTC